MPPTIATSLITCNYFLEVHFKHAGMSNSLDPVSFPIHIFTPEKMPAHLYAEEKKGEVKETEGGCFQGEVKMVNLAQNENL
mmetsp:Transcript_3347/g.2314  ORF Transcript_3347/g.2314 Transcript_3347/m.2314 type:complete len:81 (+) Transcript_3347:200-442(+)